MHEQAGVNKGAADKYYPRGFEDQRFREHKEKESEIGER